MSAAAGRAERVLVLIVFTVFEVARAGRLDHRTIAWIGGGDYSHPPVFSGDFMFSWTLDDRYAALAAKLDRRASAGRNRRPFGALHDDPAGRNRRPFGALHDDPFAALFAVAVAAAIIVIAVAAREHLPAVIERALSNDH